MPLLIIVILIALVAAYFGAIQSGLLAPAGAETLIHIRNGKVEIRRGHLRPQVKEDVEEILRAHSISTGFVAITAAQRVRFSRRIPREAHQRLRNVLLNG